MQTSYMGPGPGPGPWAQVLAVRVPCSPCVVHTYTYAYAYTYVRRYVHTYIHTISLIVPFQCHTTCMPRGKRHHQLSRTINSQRWLLCLRGS